jgi:prolyl oligopeptidase
MLIQKTLIATLAFAMALAGVPIGMADEGTKSKTSEPSKETGSTDSQVAIDEAVATREDDKPEALGTVTRGKPEGQDIEDAYLWLEDVTGEAALDWVRKRNAESIAELATSDEFDNLNRRLRDILDSDTRIPFISKIGPYYYNFWRDANHVRGIWRRLTLDEYRRDNPNWEIVFDLDALAMEEGENWVWKGAAALRPDHTRCLMFLSRGGADATVVREFDLTTTSFVDDGFTLAEAKGSVAWRSLDSIFVATDFGPDSLTTSGYPRLVKQWKRGTPLAEAETVFEGRPSDVSVSAFHDPTPGFEREFVVRRSTFYSHEYYLRRDDMLVKIEVPDDVRAFRVHRELLLIELRREWTVGETTYPAGALLATDFEDFLDGKRRLDVLFEPTDRKSLAGFTVTLNHILLNELDNVSNRISLLTKRGDEWHRGLLSSASDYVTTAVRAMDDLESDDYLLLTTGFLSPQILLLGTAGKDGQETLKHSPPLFDAEDLVVSQHETVSQDGTRVPYFQVARRDLALNGRNPTLLTGYGGFQISRVPYYNAIAGAAWLENGGVYVVANIRGGGEFGPKWHQAALQANRPRAYEDFVSVAEDLIHRQVTSPKHLGCMGGSNGGLLVGNMLTMRPDLFDAIVCQVPLLDMRRYSRLLAGASWIAEYGDPDNPDEWQLIREYSPYHNIRTDGVYPRALLTTSTRDDRVHPGHARKMLAKMAAMGHDVLYYENIEGGHAGAADNEQRAYMSAMEYIFLWNQLK